MKGGQGQSLAENSDQRPVHAGGEKEFLTNLSKSHGKTTAHRIMDGKFAALIFEHGLAGHGGLVSCFCEINPIERGGVIL